METITATHHRDAASRTESHPDRRRSRLRVMPSPGSRSRGGVREGIVHSDSSSIGHGTLALGATRLRGHQRILRVLAVVLLVASLSSTFDVRSADALTTGSVGRPGGVAFQKVGGQYVTYSGVTTSGLRIEGPYVTRSTASTDTQTVWFQAIVEQWYGDRWVTVWNSGPRGTYLSPGHNGRFLDPFFAPVGRGHFRVTEYVYWQDSRNQNLGGTAGSFDRSGDYYCLIAACSVGQSWINL